MATDYEIERVLVASTAHMTKHDNELLMNHEVCQALDYGWLIYVNPTGEEEDTDIPAFLELGISESLVALMRLARTLNCTHLKMDADGPIYAGYPEFDW